MYNSPKTDKHQKGKGAMAHNEFLGFRGKIKVELFDKNGVLLDKIEQKNFIVDLGHETVIDILDGTQSWYFFRMAIGDDGATAGDPYTPKTADTTWPARTTLFHEVVRKNIDTNTQPTSKSMRYVCSFASADITAGSFNTNPNVINEASLIISAGTQSGIDEIEQGYTPDADEKMFSIRTFKSLPFDPADTLTATITWTIYVQ